MGVEFLSFAAKRGIATTARGHQLRFSPSPHAGRCAGCFTCAAATTTAFRLRFRHDMSFAEAQEVVASLTRASCDLPTIGLFCSIDAPGPQHDTVRPKPWFWLVIASIQAGLSFTGPGETWRCIPAFSPVVGTGAFGSSGGAVAASFL